MIGLCWRSQRSTHRLLNNISIDTYLIKVSDSSKISKLNNREKKPKQKTEGDFPERGRQARREEGANSAS